MQHENPESKFFIVSENPIHQRIYDTLSQKCNKSIYIHSIVILNTNNKCKHGINFGSTKKIY